jgi:cyclophilin family peptidyl-prolyl cis-trans isomerase/HEAT repeat protein
MNWKVTAGFLFSYILLTVFSCLPPVEKPLSERELDYSDKTFRKIIEHQDKRQSDSLISYFDHHKALYRYAAVSAVLSIQDSALLDHVVKRLNDPDDLIRETAALAIGLIGDASIQDSLVAAFGKFDTINYNTALNMSILEALGRIGDEKYLDYLSKVSTYRPSDTRLIMGQAKALYRYKLRKISTPEGTQRMVDIMTGRPYSLTARYIAGRYLMLCSKEELIPHTQILIRMMRNVKDNILKKYGIIILGKTGNSEVLGLFDEILVDALTDISVKSKIFEALGEYSYSEVSDLVKNALASGNEQLAFAAAEYIYQHGQAEYITEYRRLAAEQQYWHALIKLHSAVLRYTPQYFTGTKARAIQDIMAIFGRSNDVYEKSMCIKALGNDLNSFDVIYSTGFKSELLPVRTASMEALGSIMNSEQVRKANDWARRSHKARFLPMLRDAMISGDAVLAGLASDAIMNSPLDYRDELKEGDLIKIAKNSMQMPRDISSLRSVNKLEAKINNKQYIEPGVEHNNPIDWQVFDELPDTVKVSVKTGKGDISLELYKKKAPATVVSFVNNIKSGFYNGKAFHRVVPDFVIQTGCPRGDGYGSPDYTVRTETSDLRFDNAGYVGMASAGRDTESSQWFVTMTATPHLDGRYTLFGKVTKGISVVRNIQIGDTIEKMSVK